MLCIYLSVVVYVLLVLLIVCVSVVVCVCVCIYVCLTLCVTRYVLLVYCVAIHYSLRVQVLLLHYHISHTHTETNRQNTVYCLCIILYIFIIYLIVLLYCVPTTPRPLPLPHGIPIPMCMYIYYIYYYIIMCVLCVVCCLCVNLLFFVCSLFARQLWLASLAVPLSVCACTAPTIVVYQSFRINDCITFVVLLCDFFCKASPCANQHFSRSSTVTAPAPSSQQCVVCYLLLVYCAMPWVEQQQWMTMHCSIVLIVIYLFKQLICYCFWYLILSFKRN